MGGTSPARVAPADLGSRGEAFETLPRLFAHAARWKGDAPFLVDAHGRWTGREAIETVERLAAGLSRLGIGRGSVVAMLCGSSARHALVFFACQRLGAVVCALHTRETGPALADVLDWLDADMVVADDAFADIARAAVNGSACAPPLVTLGDEPVDGAAAAFPDLAAADLDDALGDGPGPEDLAAILLSSGTTGAPKGVMHLQRTLYATAMAGPFVYGPITPHDSTVVMMGPSFAAWIHVVLPYMAGRAKIVFGQSFDPERFLDDLSREQITMAPLVPTMWRAVLAAAEGGKRDLPALRVAFFSGEPGSPDLVAALHERLGADVSTAHLASEGGCASGCVATSEQLLHAGKAGTTGQPVPGAELMLVRPDSAQLEPVSDGEVGEMLLRSRSMSVGYWRDAERTATRFVNGWWRSGDLGYLDAERDLFVVGRTDNVINTGGVKVHAEEIEAALCQHPAVRMAGVIGVPDPKWGQRVEAHLVVEGPSSADEILSFCRDRGLLSPVKLPKQVVLCERLPTGPTGKLYRNALRSAGTPAGTHGAGTGVREDT